MVAACREAGVMLALGSSSASCQVRARPRARPGRRAGRIYHLHQREQHAGPHSRWFYERDAAGGDPHGHGLPRHRVMRWVLDYPKIEAVYARMQNHLHPTASWRIIAPFWSSSKAG